MAGGKATEWGEDHACEYKTKIGIRLFALYCIIYTGFVIINTVKPQLMATKIIAGLNLACVYGFGMIILAIIMGMIYNFMCTKAENQMNNTKKETNS